MPQQTDIASQRMSELENISGALCGGLQCGTSFRPILIGYVREKSGVEDLYKGVASGMVVTGHHQSQPGICT